MKRSTNVVTALLSLAIFIMLTMQPVLSEPPPDASSQHFTIAQAEEGDIDESYDLYGPDTDEEIEYDDAMVSPADTSRKKVTPELPPTSVDSLISGIRWLGHASFLIENDEKIYIDPFDLPAHVPPADIILITHEHSDHFSPDDIDRIAGDSTIVVSVDAIRDRLSEAITHFRGVKPGDTVRIRDVRIEAVPAYNIDRRFHPKKKGYLGFVITYAGTAIYHAGDTDRIPEMEDIEADVALLPVGGKYTMDATQAAEAANLMKPKVAIPMHWGKIVGTEEDATVFKAKCDVRVVTLKPKTERAEPGEE